jgi:MFS family permease
MAYQPVHDTDGSRLSDGRRGSGSLAGSLALSDTPTRLSPRTRRVLISIAASTVMALFGYEQGILGGIIVGAEFNRYFNHPSTFIIGWVTSVYDLGSLLGSLVTLGVGEWLGRKRMLLVFTAIMTIGIVIQTLAQSIVWLFLGRVIAGIGNGGNTATAPVWHMETTTAEFKSKAVTLDMTANVVGYVVSNIITLSFSHIGSDAQWRLPLGIQLVMPIIILALVPFLPESPRWLLSRGHDFQALTAQARLSDYDVQEEFRELRKSVRVEMAAQASGSEINKGTQWRRMILGMMLQVCQQLSGINLCVQCPLKHTALC